MGPRVPKAKAQTGTTTGNCTILLSPPRQNASQLYAFNKRITRPAAESVFCFFDRGVEIYVFSRHLT
jgi:hypothetical protein